MEHNDHLTVFSEYDVGSLSVDNNAFKTNFLVLIQTGSSGPFYNLENIEQLKVNILTEKSRYFTILPSFLYIFSQSVLKMQFYKLMEYNK